MDEVRVVNIPRGFLVWWYGIQRGRIICNNGHAEDFDKRNKMIFNLVKEAELKTDYVSHKRREPLFAD